MGFLRLRFSVMETTFPSQLGGEQFGFEVHICEIILNRLPAAMRGDRPDEEILNPVPLQKPP